MNWVGRSLTVDLSFIETLKQRKEKKWEFDGQLFPII